MDNKELIVCPACGEDMKKIVIPTLGINLDICLDGCGGIYFDNRELDKFDEPTEDVEEIMNAIKDKTFNSVDESQTRICPVCKKPMVKNGFAGSSVQIDVCYSCGGKFLDDGELQAIRNANLNVKNEKTEELCNILFEKNYDETVPNVELLEKLGFKGYSNRAAFLQQLIYRNL